MGVTYLFTILIKGLCLERIAGNGLDCCAPLNKQTYPSLAVCKTLDEAEK